MAASSFTGRGEQEDNMEFERTNSEIQRLNDMQELTDA